jgi:hypothetical protein
VWRFPTKSSSCLTVFTGRHNESEKQTRFLNPLQKAGFKHSRAAHGAFFCADPLRRGQRVVAQARSKRGSPEGESLCGPAGRHSGGSKDVLRPLRPMPPSGCARPRQRPSLRSARVQRATDRRRNFLAFEKWKSEDWHAGLELHPRTIALADHRLRQEPRSQAEFEHCSRGRSQSARHATAERSAVTVARLDRKSLICFLVSGFQVCRSTSAVAAGAAFLSSLTGDYDDA